MAVTRRRIASVLAVLAAAVGTIYGIRQALHDDNLPIRPGDSYTKTRAPFSSCPHH